MALASLVPTRSGSVVDLAVRRQACALFLLFAAPLLMLLGWPGVPFALVSVLGVVALTLGDVVAWAGAGLASRRMRQGHRPRARVDYGVGDDWEATVAAGAPYREVHRGEPLAVGSPIAARAVIGGSLRRRAYGALVCGGACALVVLLAWPGMRAPDLRFQTSLARGQLKEIRDAAELGRVRGSPCPTVDELRARGKLEADFATIDPWGTPYEIACGGPYDTPVPSSAGPDRRFGTVDDVMLLPP